MLAGKVGQLYNAIQSPRRAPGRKHSHSDKTRHDRLLCGRGTCRLSRKLTLYLRHVLHRELLLHEIESFVCKPTLGSASSIEGLQVIDSGKNILRVRDAIRHSVVDDNSNRHML